jgi:hypothetical protein
MANIPLPTSIGADTDLNASIFFNGYYSQPIQVSDNVWGQIYGYFIGLTNNSESANALSQAVVAICYNNGLDPLTLLKEFQANPAQNNVKNLLISFFNSTKGSTSKLGFKNNLTTNKYIERNLLA